MFDKTYLDKLIHERIEENLNLDFKASASLERSDTKTKEISKDVSAFANSAGGVIIYGLKEDSANKHLAGEIDPINRGKISKEWLEQIIQSSIQPRIENIIIHPIEIDGDENKVVYVVDIPKSTTAHQAVDNRYYRRFNFNSVPMYDYEIRDVFNRVKNPIISIEFVVNHYDQTNASYLKVFARNNGTVLAKYINCYIEFPLVCLIDDDDTYETETIKRFGDNTVREITDVLPGFPGNSPKYRYGPSRYDPLLPRLRTKLSFSDIELSVKYSNLENQIAWVVYADNAEPISGITLFHDIEVNFL